jgi:hypothetical protein
MLRSGVASWKVTVPVITASVVVAAVAVSEVPARAQLSATGDEEEAADRTDARKRHVRRSGRNRTVG